MSDTISIKGISVHAYHGAREHETLFGQRFLIDLDLALNISTASQSDRLEDTVCYAQIVAATTEAFRKETYVLLERAAGAVVEAVLGSFPRIDSIEVTVRKSSLTLETFVEDIGVILRRSRSALITLPTDRSP